MIIYSIREKIHIIDIIPGIYIFMYYVSLLSVSMLVGTVSVDGNTYYFIEHPSILNHIILVIMNLLVARKIFSNVKASDRTHLLYLMGTGLYFIIIPFFSLLGIIFHKYHLYIFNISNIMAYIGMFMISITFIFDQSLFFNLIPQKIEKLIIMNRGGLPLLSYDFIKKEDVLSENLLFSGSITGLSKYLSTQQSDTVKSIKLINNHILFYQYESLTFLLVINTLTRYVISNFQRWSILFGDQFEKSISNTKFVIKNYYDIDDVKTSIEDYFYKKKSVQNNVTDTLKEYIITLYFSIVGLRVLIFNIVQIVVEVDNYFNSTKLGIFLMLVIIIIFIYRNKLKLNNKGYQILIILYMISALSAGFIQLLLILIFSILSFYYLNIEYQKNNPKTRYAGFLFAVILDILIRFIFKGVEPVIAEKNIIFIIIIGSIGLFVFRKIKSPSTLPIKNSMPMIWLIVLILMIRLSLNTRYYLSFYSSYTYLDYYLAVMIYFTIYLIFISINFKHNQILLISSSLIIIISILLLKTYFLLMAFIIPLVNLSLAYILSVGSKYPKKFKMKGFEFNLYRIESKILINLSIFILYFFAAFYSYYGGTTIREVIILLFSFLIFLYTIDFKSINIKKNVNSFYEISIQSIKNIKILFFVFMLLLSLLVPNYSITRITTDAPLGIMTYNTQFGISSEGNYNPEGMSNYIISTGVSIVALQEITRFSFLNGNSDLYLQLKELLWKGGFKYSVIMNNNPEIFSNVIFSKYPIISTYQSLFPDNEAYFKGFIASTIEYNNIKIQIINTHLTHIYSVTANRTRFNQISYLLKNINLENPTILLGDFNVEPESPVISEINKYFISYQYSGTWPAENPNMLIDYIFSYNINLINVGTDDVRFSDHLPVIAWIK